jgi:hypothetical protein
VLPLLERLRVPPAETDVLRQGVTNQVAEELLGIEHGVVLHESGMIVVHVERSRVRARNDPFAREVFELRRAPRTVR